MHAFKTSTHQVESHMLIDMIRGYILLGIMLDIHTACVQLWAGSGCQVLAGLANVCPMGRREAIPGNPIWAGAGWAGRGKAILRANSVRAKIRLGPATLQTSQIRSGGSLVFSGCDIDVYIDMHNLQRKGCLNTVYP